MPRIRDYAYNRSNRNEQGTGQALKVTMFEEETAKSKEGDDSSVEATEQSENVQVEKASQSPRIALVANNSTDFESEKESLDEVKVSALEYKNPKSAKQSEQSAEINSNKIQGDNMVEKIEKAEVDLNPKYTDALAAINSITQIGDYYEDYAKGAANSLTQNKEFVLCVIAQNPDRFYSPHTPTPSDWLDEEFITSELRYMFDRLEEGDDQSAVDTISATLYEFLHRAAFSQEAYAKIVTQAKLVAKVASACVVNPQDGERTKQAINRFFDAIKAAKTFAKARHENSQKEMKERLDKLETVKKGLFNFINVEQL